MRRHDAYEKEPSEHGKQYRQYLRIQLGADKIRRRWSRETVDIEVDKNRHPQKNESGQLL
jgi:hypothetical protein